MSDALRMIDDYLEGSLPADRCAELAAWIKASPDNAAVFADKSALHARLADVLGPRVAAESEIPHTLDEAKKATADRAQETAPLTAAGFPMYRKGYEPQPSKIRPHHVALAGVAAVLLAACGVAVYLFAFNAAPTDTPDPAQPGPAFATLIESTGGNLTTPHDYPAEGERYASGDYTLDAGRAEFVLSNRVTVNLRGATRLRMYNAANVYLAQGRAEFKVPTGVDGFTVHLPDRSKIVDLGTAFRVEVDDAGQTKLRVTEGRVVWSTDNAVGPPVHVDAGQTALLIDGVPTLTANPGLVAYWPLNDGPAGSAVTGADDVIDDDAHPATDAAVEGNGETWIDDPDRGTVLNTTATGNLIAGTQGITGDFTWSLWIKTTDATKHVVMGNRSGSSPWNRLTPTGTQNWANIAERTDPFTVADGQWHHLVYRRAGDTVSVWIDGEMHPETAKQTASQDGPLRIGGDAQYGQRLVGQLSDVAIWEIALDESRIRALAAGGPVVLPQKLTDQPTPPSEPADRPEDPRDSEGPTSEKNPSLNGDPSR